MLDVRNMMVQRREHQLVMRFCLLAYPCQVWVHRWFTPCIVSVFPLSRVLQRGTFHSAGISRFIARPGPVPLQRPHLHRSVTLPVHTRAWRAQEGPCTPGLLLYRCSARCCLRPRGLVSHFPWRALTHGLRAGQYAQQTPNLSRSRGYVSDSGHTPFTSPNPHDPKPWFRAVGSTLPRKASVMRRTLAYFPSQ